MTDPNQPPQAPPPPPQQPPPGYQPPPSYASPQGFPSAPPPPAGQAVMPGQPQLATVGRRIGAWFLSIVLIIVTLVIGYLIWGLILWGRGQTPALKVLGMRVWKVDQQRPATFGDMVLREVVGRFLLGIVPFEQLISFVVFLATGQHRAIHDYVGGTIVLHDPNKVIPGA